MKKLIQLLLVLCATLMVAGLSSRAQAVPQMINYQGQLLDAGGTPMLTGDYDVEFRLFPVESSGTAVWGPQVFNGQSGVGLGPKVSVVNGHFNLVIGPKDTLDRNLGDVVAANPSLFLEIKVGAGSPIAPRQQLLTAPYSLTSANAGNAAKLSGYDWGALFSNGNPQTGNMGLGQPPTSATMKLDVKGRMRVRNVNEASAGIWMNQLVNGAELDRSFIGMADNNRVGFWSSPLGYWPFTMDVTTGTTRAEDLLTPQLTIGVGITSAAMYCSDLFSGSFNATVDSGVFYFHGSVYAHSHPTFSDERIKENIEEVQKPLEKLRTIRSVTFNYKKDSLQAVDATKRHVGVLAQDVNSVIPEAVVTSPEGHLAVNYDELIPVLIGAVNEQQKQIEALRAELAALKNR